MAIELAGRGHTVFAAARRRAELDDLAASQAGIVAVPLDVTDQESIDAAWSVISAATQGAGVDVLINAAGYALTGPVETLSTEEVKHGNSTPTSSGCSR